MDGAFSHPVWSTDGQKLYFMRQNSRQVYSALMRGVQATAISQESPEAVPGFTMIENEQGESVLHVANSSDVGNDSVAEALIQNDKVFVRRNPGEASELITDDEGQYDRATLAPNAERVAYSSPHTGIHVLKLDGKSKPMHLGEGISPEWLGDSSGFLYRWTRRDENGTVIAGDIYLADADGSTISDLTQTPEIPEGSAAADPSSSRVAYEANGVIYVAWLR
jgi:Tol biopolymer transport system component